MRKYNKILVIEKKNGNFAPAFLWTIIRLKHKTQYTALIISTVPNQPPALSAML